jgi:hypothetical protein
VGAVSFCETNLDIGWEEDFFDAINFDLETGASPANDQALSLKPLTRSDSSVAVEMVSLLLILYPTPPPPPPRVGECSLTLFTSILW